MDKIHNFLTINSGIYKMRKVLFLLFLTVSSLFSQNPNWSSFITFPQYPSPYFSDWERNPNIGTLNINYIGTAPVEFYFEIIINIDGYGEAIRGRTAKREYLSGPVSEVLTFSDISDWEQTTVNKELQRIVVQSGKLPESNYSICVNAFALNGELLTDACTDFEIVLPNPPQLISPSNEGVIEIAQPTFMWNPIVAPANILPYYQIKIVELLEGQTPFRAMEANIPLVEAKVLNENMYIYRLDDYTLEQNHLYAWQVQAINEEGIPIATNDGFSEIWQFSFGKYDEAISLDTLMLIEDYAYLLDVKGLKITDHNSFLNLDGACRMLLKNSDGIDKYIDVVAQNLMLQKENYHESPVFLGGNVVGTIYENILDAVITGNYFKPTKLEFTPPNQLTIAGNFYLDESVDIPLNGKLNYIDGELSGELSLIGNRATPLFEMGDESFKIDLSSLSLSFPSSKTNLEGELSIFGTPSNCKVTEIELQKDGEYVANISCNIEQEIALLQGSTLFNLNVNSIEGKISGNLITNKVKYSVFVDGGLLFNIDPDNSFGADIQFELQPNNFKLISFNPTVEGNTSSIDLGWLKWNIQKIKLNNLAYKKKNWDFNLSMDMDLSFPDFSDNKFPTLRNIAFTPRGIEFPEIKFDNFIIPNINFDGFGLEIYGLRSQAYTFDLSKWSPGLIANFSFDFDALLTMPNLPNGTADNLLASSIKISPKITGGNFSVDIPEIQFKTPLAMPLMNGIKFNVSNILGSIGSNYDGTLFSYLPKINFKGKLELPEGFSCNDGEASILPIDTKLLVSSNGKLSGVAKNIIPKCPIKFGATSLYFNDSKIEFINGKNQQVILDGTCGIKFTEDEQTRPIGKLQVEYDVLNNKIISIEGEINEKFKLDIMPGNPILSFAIKYAKIKNNILEIDGRNRVVFNGNNEVGATFDQLEIDLNSFDIIGGTVYFDSGFNIKATGIDVGNLVITSHPSGTKLNGEEGLMLSFSEKIGINKNGFTVSGDASAEVVFNGQEYSDLVVEFTKDFAFNPIDFSVNKGRADFLFKGNRLAYWNEEGLIPDMSFFMNNVIPDRIPLPTLDIAYLQVRRNDSLLVNITTDGDEIRIETLEGKPIPLVMPGLQFEKPLAPQMNVDFDITFNTSREEVSSGFIFVQIPEEDRLAFDLSQIGIPYQVHSIFYGKIEGEYGFRLTGKPKLFETEFVCSDSTSLIITRGGTLIGHMACNLETVIPMVPGSDRLNLIMNRITGDFNIDLPTRAIDFDFELDSDIRFKLNENDDWGVWTLLGYTPRGLAFRDSRVDSVGIGRIALSNFELGISNLSLPNLSYTSNTGWNFEFGMDIELAFPELNFSFNIPSDRGMSLTKTGFHFPEISINDSDISDSLKFELNGFEILPIAFRTPAFNFNWFDPMVSESNWGFKFDFDINLPNVQGSRRKITLRDISFNDGLFIGEFPNNNSEAGVLEFEHGELDLNFGNGLGFEVNGISINFFDDDGSQGSDFKFKGKLKMPEFASCQNADGTIYDISNTEFNFSSSGLLSGEFLNFAPTCPIDIGIGKFNVTESSLFFSVAENKQKVIMDMDGTLLFPIGDADSVTATGGITLDLLTGKMIDGFVEVDRQFVWSIPNDNPVLRFNINSARIDTSGFSVTGDSELVLPEGRFERVRFERFKFDIERYKVKSGRVVISSDIGLKIVLADDGINWKVIGKDDPLTENRSAKIGVGGELILDKDGLAFTGESLAAIRWSEDINHQFDSLRVVYSNERDGSNKFAFTLSPFEVWEGKAELFSGDDLIASIDHNGFHPGEGVFGRLPIPEIIPLPDSLIAYLRIKDKITKELLIDTSPAEDGSGTELTTRDGSPLKLVFPSLKSNERGATEPTFDVVLNNVVYNFSSMTFVSGSIVVTGNEGASIINLSGNGIPVELFSIRYGNVDGTNKLTANGRISLPGALSEFPIELEDLEFDENGIAGSLTMGQYSLAYAEHETIAFSNVGDNAIITLEGFQTEFGDTKSFKFSGKFIPKMFVAGGDTSKIHYAAVWDRNKFNFNLDLPEGGSINMGVAKFIPTLFGELPAMQLTFTERPTADFALILNGQILVDSFGDGFSLDFRNLRISRSNFSVDNIHLEGEDQFNFELFKSRFIISDVGFSYTENLLKMNLAGKLNFFGKPITFRNLEIGTDGNFNMGEVAFVTPSSPLIIVNNFLTLTKLKFEENKLVVGGNAKLPKPASSEKTFDFNFSIGANGRLYDIGNSEFVFFNDANQELDNDGTEYDFWVGDFDPTYLSLFLDFEHIERSKIKMVADVYFDNNPIEIGSKNGLNDVSPGFEIDFNGETTWGDISYSPGKYDWEMLEINVEELSLLTNRSGINFELTGHIGLAFDEVGGGGIEFGKTNKGGLIITSTGEVENFSRSISGGDISIYDIIDISVTSLDFAENLDITIDANSSSGNNLSTEERVISVDNFFTFEGAITIAELFEGGIDRFVTYTDEKGNYVLIIENAHLDIKSTLDVRVDFIYEEIDDSFTLLAGGSGSFGNELTAQKVMVVAKFGKDSYGFYLASNGLDIQLGPVKITGLGGGFFYHPSAQDILLVKSISQLNNSSAMQKIKTPEHANFAVFLYGSLAFIDEHIVEGRVLLMLAGSTFTLDGDVVILAQDNRLYGTVNLQVDFFNKILDGNITVHLKLWKLLNGDGEVNFYVYENNVWGIIGDVDLNLLNFITSSSHFFVGPSGFLVNVSANKSFDIEILEVSAGFESQIWYLNGVSWGAYAEAKVAAEVFAGIIAAKGKLMCALVGADDDFYIYGEAGISVSVLGFSGSANVYAKIYSDGIEGGEGHDSKLARLIDEAKDLASEAEAEANAIKDVIENHPPPQPESITFTAEEVAGIFNSLSEWGRKYKYGTNAEKTEADRFLQRIKSVETNIQGIDNYFLSADENKIYNLVIEDIYKANSAPFLIDYQSGLDGVDSAIIAYTNARTEYISNFDFALDEIDAVQFAVDSLSGNPINLSNFREPQFEYYLDEEGVSHRRLIVGTQPSFNIDENLVEENKNKSIETMAKLDNYEDYVKQQIEAIDNNIEKIETILLGTDGHSGAEGLSSEYTNIITKVGEAYTSKFFFDKRFYYWSEHYSQQIWSNQSQISSIMQQKSIQIYDQYGWEVLRNLTAERAKTMKKLAGKDGNEDYFQIINSWGNYHDEESDLQRLRDFFTKESARLGTKLWYDVPNLGVHALRNNAMNIVPEDVERKNGTIDYLRTFQANFTEHIDNLYSLLATMYEKKENILTHLIYLKQLHNINARGYEAQKNAIVQKMRMPTIGTLQVQNVDYGLYSQSNISWGATGDNSSKVNYLIDYSQSYPDIASQGLQAVGNKRFLKLFHLPNINQQHFGEVEFIVNARIPIGYKINRLITFVPRFSNTNEIVYGDVTISEAEIDFTPPEVTPTITFPDEYAEYSFENNGVNSRKCYIGNPNLLTVSFEAFDRESGIQEYLYKLVEVQNPDIGNPSSVDALTSGISLVALDYNNTNSFSDLNFIANSIQGTEYKIQCQPLEVVKTIVPPTTNYGRNNIVLNTINLENNKAYKLIVSAVNGSGINAITCGGLKQYIIVDTTPPTKPAFIHLPILNNEEASIGNGVVNPPVELSDGVPFNYNITYGSKIGNSLNEASNAEYYCAWGSSNDNESGLKNYEYKVTKKKDESITTSWLSNGRNRNVVLRNNSDTTTISVANMNNAIERNLSIGGDGSAQIDYSLNGIENRTFTNVTEGIGFLNYNDVFYVDIRAVNSAQLPSEPIRYTFTPKDNTPPSDVDVSLAYSHSGSRAVLIFNSHSHDAESGIDYYEVAAGYRTDGNLNHIGWDKAIKIEPTDISTIDGTYLLPQLVEHSRSYIAVRAVNKQGMKGKYCYTGPFLHDETRPNRPRVNISKRENNALVLRFLNVRDAQSGIKKVEYKVDFQDLNSSTWNSAVDWTNSDSHNSIRIPFSTLGINLSQKVKVSVRTTNRVGLVSLIGVNHYVLDTTLPIKPTVTVAFSSKASDHSKHLTLNFGNIEDPETGIEKIEYEISKRARSLYNVSGYRYQVVESWRSNGKDLSKSYSYTQLGLSSGNRLMIRVKTTNKRGFVSEVTTKYITLP